VRPDADVIVPMYAPYAHADLVSPFATTRNISALLRFEITQNDGKYLMANHGARAPLAQRARRARAPASPCAWMLHGLKAILRSEPWR